MNKISLSSLLFLTLAFSNNLSSNEDAENILRYETFKYSNFFLGNFANDIASSLSAFDSVKYLDMSIKAQENLKPSIDIMNVNKIHEWSSGAIFNQNSLAYHDDEQYINFGLGIRDLINGDKIILGANTFYDYAFEEGHQRHGFGLEVISSMLDFRSNYYNADGDIKNLTNGSTEEALDGWDTRLDFHIPVGFDLRFFGTIFEWENSNKTFDRDGTVFGLSGQYGFLKFEGGYRDEENQDKQAFLEFRLVIPLNGGSQGSSTSKRGFLEMVSVRDQLYEPVERENKIRVVKISSGNIIISGF